MQLSTKHTHQNFSAVQTIKCDSVLLDFQEFISSRCLLLITWKINEPLQGQSMHQHTHTHTALNTSSGTPIGYCAFSPLFSFSYSICVEHFCTANLQQTLKSWLTGQITFFRTMHLLTPTGQEKSSTVAAWNTRVTTQPGGESTEGKGRDC